MYFFYTAQSYLETVRCIGKSEYTTATVQLCVCLYTGVNVSVYISVFDYGSGEATGSRWPRQPQASRVSELSIPPWLLHSCENRKAAPTTNTRGIGGKTANLWLINNRSFLSLQDLFPIFQNCWLNGN